MELFTKKRSYLGVDLGTGSIKVVELTNVGGQARLETYGFAELPAGDSKLNAHEKLERTAATLSEICTKARVKSLKAVAALPTFSVFSSLLNLPLMSESEVGQALAYEAKKIVPLPLDEMILDWKILSAQAANPMKREKTMRVLLTAAPKNLVKQYLEIFRLAKIEILSLETEAFALGRALLGLEPAVALLVDVGALTTDVAVVDEHIPVLNRSIDVGGVTVTKAIAQSLNIDIKRAEQFKRDVGLQLSGSSTTAVPKIIEATLGPIVNEVKYAISLYQAESAKSIEKIVITGGSAFLPQLTQYLENVFQLKVFIGNPWSQVACPVDLKGVLDEIGPRFATAIGLALREIHK
jgi:type IV pilus assembly protein PilM